MHRSFLIFAAAFIALMAGALFYAARMPVREAQAPVSSPANVSTPVDFPAFTLAGLDGTTRNFAEFGGRHRLLNFWATWCAPCRREIPLLKSFQADQGADGILVIGIAVDFIEEVRAYAEAADFNYPILVGQEDAMDVAESSGLQFNAMPFTMVISRDGQYLGAYLGELHTRQLDDITSILARLDAGEISVENAKGALKLL
jgi:thiol-disulfide isomerase/thioredoxin